MKKILGLDYGKKNIGISLSDPFCSIAFPHGKVERDKSLEEIKKLLESENIKTIVLGKPMNLKGQETKMTQEVIEFKEKLKIITDIPVVLQDERLSSIAVDKAFQQMNINSKKRRPIKDALEACHILQSYLDKTNN